VKDEGPKKENSVEIEPTRRGLGKLRDPSSQSQICDRRLRAITMVSSRVSGALRALIFAALIALASAAKGVVQAGDSNFDRLVLGSGKNAFVKFLAPW
jgi:hypothetical protein